MSKETYEDGYKRGRDGDSSNGTIMDDLLWDSKEDKYSRERGFEDGIRDRLREEHQKKTYSSSYSSSHQNHQIYQY